jgi:hypothetical protein
MPGARVGNEGKVNGSDRFTGSIEIDPAIFASLSDERMIVPRVRLGGSRG